MTTSKHAELGSLALQEERMTDQARKAERFRGLHVPGSRLSFLISGMRAARGPSQPPEPRRSRRVVGRSRKPTASPMASVSHLPWWSTICAGSSLQRTCR